jgi:2-keto-myo-inositol isomerase
MTPFRFCLNTSTIRGQKLPLQQVIEITAQAGYDGIEPWIDEIDAYVASGENLRDLKARLDDAGLQVESAIGFFDWIVDDDAQRQKGFEEARRNMELVAQIGGKYIAAPPMGAQNTKGVSLFCAAERYAQLLELGAQHGVTPLLEVWGFSKTLNRLGEAALIAVESGRSDACILADVYHLYKGGSPIEGLNLLRGSQLPLFHVNDYPDIARDQIQDADRVYPGDGVAPLLQIFQQLQDIGFNGALSLELFNPTYYQQDALLVAQTGLQKLRQVVEAGS